MGRRATGRPSSDSSNGKRPAVVVLDAAMPGLPGAAALKRIRERLPDVKVVVFGDGSAVEIEAMLRLGATAYVVGRIDAAHLPMVIRFAAAGSTFISAGEGRRS